MVQRPQLKLNTPSTQIGGHPDEQPGTYTNPLPDPTSPVPAATPVVTDAPPPPSLPNAPTSHEQDLAKLLNDAENEGKVRGKGDVSFVKLGRMLVQGGVKGTLKPSTKDPSNHAKMMFERFAKGRKQMATADGVAVIEDNEEKKASQEKSDSAQISKVRTFIRLGDVYKGEAEPIFDDTIQVHGSLMANPRTIDQVKYRSTYSALIEIARAHVSKERMDAGKVRMSEAEIRNLLVKDIEEAKEATGPDILANAMKLVQSAINGRTENAAKSARDPVDHHLLPQVVDDLRTVLGEISPETLKAHDDAIEAALKRKADAAVKKANEVAEAQAKKNEKARLLKEKEDKAEKDAATARVMAALAAGEPAPVFAEPSDDEPEDEDEDETGEKAVADAE